jgi:hypothetical protein
MSSRERINDAGRAVLLCPFHREKTPSLCIWPDTGFYCHGCGRKGWLKDHPDIANKYVLMLSALDDSQLALVW